MSIKRGRSSRSSAPTLCRSFVTGVTLRYFKRMTIWALQCAVIRRSTAANGVVNFCGAINDFRPQGHRRIFAIGPTSTRKHHKTELSRTGVDVNEPAPIEGLVALITWVETKIADPQPESEIGSPERKVPATERQRREPKPTPFIESRPGEFDKLAPGQNPRAMPEAFQCCHYRPVVRPSATHDVSSVQAVRLLGCPG
jgi:hypothetical protein